MARLLLIGVLALAAAPGAGASGTRPAGRCAASQLEVSVRTQGEASTAWIGVTVRNPGAVCSLSGSAVFTIEQAGRVAVVKGNPLRIRVRGTLGRGHTRLVKADWHNWCRSRRHLALVVRYGGLTRRAKFAVLPLCIDRRHPSQLEPID